MFYIGDRLDYPPGKVFIDETRHMFIAGGSGSGKSSLLSRLGINAVREGHSLVLIDPHAVFAETVLEYIPRARLRDVIVFDPLSNRPIGLPPLEAKNELSADTFIKILAEQFGANSFMGRSYMIVRNFVYALVDVFPKPTAFHVWLMFMFDDYAKWIFSKCSSNTLSQWSQKYFEETPYKQRQEAAAAPMNKEDALIALQKLRHIFAQPDGLDFFEAIQSKKIVVCILRKGMLGDDASDLLGSVILRLTLSAVLKRDPSEPNPFLTVIADEFHNFTKGTSPEAFFAETRKYGAAFITASQSGRQLPDGSLDFILPNVSNLIAFRLSGKDAKELVLEIGAPSENVLVGLKTGETYMKTVMPRIVLTGLHVQMPVRYSSNDRKKKFPLVLPAKLGTEATKGECYGYSESHYGRTRAEVDRLIDSELEAAERKGYERSTSTRSRSRKAA